MQSAEIKHDSKSGFYYREGTTHLKTVREPPNDYAGMKPGPDDRILDLGGHVGGFMVWAYRMGCRKIWTVEPAPDTFEVLSRNRTLCPEGDVRIFNAAAVPDNSPDTVPLWLTKNHETNASSCASTNFYRGRTSVVVPTISFRKLIDDLKPTQIKVDVEGAEFSLDFTNLPDHVRKIALELHWINRGKKNNKAAALALTADLESQGFREVVKSKNGMSFRDKKSWNWQVVFAR